VTGCGIVRVTVLTVPAADAELGADRMMTAGAFAVEERALPGGRVELRGQLADALPVATTRLGVLPDGWEVRIDEVDATPAETWREHAERVVVCDGLVLRPAWLPPAGGGATELEIEPGAAFGLGDHPTTRLCASAVWRLVPDLASPVEVLDVGCGTGVLGIAGVVRGAARATGIDIADAAVPVTLDNAARNGVADRVEVSTALLADVAGTYRLVLANILAPALVALADDLRRVTAPDGRLVISGILAGRHDHVLAALAPMAVVRTDELDGWAAVELAHTR
jgi:ribosomal protein L11 methyltransferase